MTATWQIVLLFLGAYLLGSIPVGLLIAKLKGVDIRKAGSGNVGATNVGRTLGKQWGILVFLLDVTKGAAISVIAGYTLTHSDQWVGVRLTFIDWIWLGTGACCIVGNVASVFLWFRGGKGVATSLGVILGIYPYLTLPGLVAFGVWAIVVKLSGYVSLGSIVAAATMPIGFVVFSILAEWSFSDHYPLLALSGGMATLVLIRHRGNMGRLLAGTENRIGKPKT